MGQSKSHWSVPWKQQQWSGLVFIPSDTSLISLLKPELQAPGQSYLPGESAESPNCAAAYNSFAVFKKKKCLLGTGMKPLNSFYRQPERKGL